MKEKQVKEYRHWKRITKYNPAYRNEQGAYMRPEWTAMSDIGKTFGEQLFTREEYLRVETAYVHAAQLLLAGANPITLGGLESWGDSPDPHAEPALYQAWQALQEGATIPAVELARVVQLMLREHTWGYLVAKPQRVKLRFGYDYYMYVNYEQLLNDTFTAIEALGLFVD